MMEHGAAKWTPLTTAGGTPGGGGSGSQGRVHQCARCSCLFVGAQGKVAVGYAYHRCQGYTHRAHEPYEAVGQVLACPPVREFPDVEDSTHIRMRSPTSPLCTSGLCGVVWCGVVWCGVVWCGVVWCGVVCRRRCYQRAKAGMSTHG